MSQSAQEPGSITEETLESRTAGGEARLRLGRSDPARLLELVQNQSPAVRRISNIMVLSRRESVERQNAEHAKLQGVVRFTL